MRISFSKRKLQAILIFSLMLGSSFAAAELGKSTEVIASNNAWNADRQTVLLEMRPVSSESTVKSQDKPAKCQLSTIGDYAHMLVHFEEKAKRYPFGTNFPTELVDLEKPLKKGFKNKVEVITDQSKETWTAEYKDGKLVIESFRKAKSLPDQTSHLEFKTKSSVVDAEEVTGKGSDFESYTFTCRSVPIS